MLNRIVFVVSAALAKYEVTFGLSTGPSKNCCIRLTIVLVIDNGLFGIGIAILLSFAHEYEKSFFGSKSGQS